jgi:hypothetical protein
MAEVSFAWLRRFNMFGMAMSMRMSMMEMTMSSSINVNPDSCEVNAAFRLRRSEYICINESIMGLCFFPWLPEKTAAEENPK